MPTIMPPAWECFWRLKSCRGTGIGILSNGLPSPEKKARGWVIWNMPAARDAGSQIRSGDGSYINIDGVGPFTGTTTAASFAASRDFDALIDEKVKAYPGHR